MSPPSSGHSPILERVLFPLGVVFILVVPIMVAVIFHDATASWIAALCGAFVVMSSKFSTLAEFSLGPLRAKMRETLDEAAATVEQLRELATSMTYAVLTDLMAASFMGGMSNETRLKLHDELIDKLGSLGATKDQIKRAESEWRKGIDIMYHRIIGANIITATNLTNTNDQNQLSAAVQALLHFLNWISAPPSEFETLSRNRDILTPEVQRWIDDFRHFRQANETRRRDEFASE